MDNFFKGYSERNNKNFKRSMTDFKIGKRINKNISKIQSFGIDVESIKEEKDEDNLSISSFEYKIDSKKRNITKKKEKSNALSSMSSFLDTNSFIPLKKDNVNKFIINCVDNFSINRKYFYPDNVRLNIKKINIKRIIPIEKNIDKNENINNNSEICKIF